MNKPALKNILFFVYLLAVCLLALLLYPFFAALTSEEGVLALEKTVQNAGFGGVLLILGLQILQIVVAFIPGEVLEFVSGVMYGTFGGLLLDLAGLAIGQSAIYWITAKLGACFAEKLAGSKAISKLKFLKNEKKVHLLLFFLYFIPGTPKDVLCYAAPLFKIPFKSFICISLVARIPSVVSSTYAGSVFRDGDFTKTIFIYGVVAVLSIGGIVLQQYMQNRRKTHGTKH